MVKGVRNCFLGQWRSILFYLFRVCGFIYTAFIIHGHVVNYLSFQSIKTQTELETSQVNTKNNAGRNRFQPNIVRIPNLMVCADSMNSKRKVAAKYPMLNKTRIQELYGLNVKGLKKSIWNIRKSLPHMFRSMKDEFDDQYSDLNQINLTQFYIDTIPGYGLIFHFVCHTIWFKPRLKSIIQLSANWDLLIVTQIGS